MQVTTYNLLKNIHETLVHPTSDGITHLVKGNYDYYHYNCLEGIDVGWGCGYRTLQTICSFINDRSMKKVVVPSIKEIQQTLVKIGDKDEFFCNSREWIGTVEVSLICLLQLNYYSHDKASYIIDELFGVACYLHHVTRGDGLRSIRNKIVTYFETQGGFMMMGGDLDASSKGIAGVHITTNDEIYLLVVDPHYVGTPNNVDELIEKQYVKWQHENEFFEQSFYNLLMPKIL
ncbi:unnamed protein product [Diamesa tonsa]